jgi:NADH-quinone oxidoreductase subunit D
LNRIASHLLWLGTHALDVGAITPLFYTLREREEVLNIFEKYCGARLTTHAFRIGGLQYELYEGFEQEVNAFCDCSWGSVDEYEELLTGNRIWVEPLKRRHPERRRLQGLRRHRPDDPRGRREVGPSQSAALQRLRKVRFRHPHRRNGDSYDRYIVRMEEMRQSVRIIRQAVEASRGAHHGQGPQGHQAARGRGIRLD